MQKVVCNVLYEAVLPVKYKGVPDFDEIKLGLFTEKKVAKIALRIVRIILSYNKSNYFTKFDQLRERLVPEDKMQRPYIQTNLVSNIDDFCTRNNYVINFVKSKGENALNEIVAASEEFVIQTYSEEDTLIK